MGGGLEYKCRGAEDADRGSLVWMPEACTVVVGACAPHTHAEGLLGHL